MQSCRSVSLVFMASRTSIHFLPDLVKNFRLMKIVNMAQNLDKILRGSSHNGGWGGNQFAWEYLIVPSVLDFICVADSKILIYLPSPTTTLQTWLLTRICPVLALQNWSPRVNRPQPVSGGPDYGIQKVGTTSRSVSSLLCDLAHPAWCRESQEKPQTDQSTVNNGRQSWGMFDTGYFQPLANQAFSLLLFHTKEGRRRRACELGC